jgi:hypothetical protein
MDAIIQLKLYGESILETLIVDPQPKPFKYFMGGIQRYVGIQKMETRMYRLRVREFSTKDFQEMMRLNPKLEVTELHLIDCKFSELPKLPSFRHLHLMNCPRLKRLAYLYFEAEQLIIHDCPKLYRLPPYLKLSWLHIYHTPICFIPDVKLEKLELCNTNVGEINFDRIEKLNLITTDFFNQVSLEKYKMNSKVIRLFHKIPTSFADIVLE